MENLGIAYPVIFRKKSDRYPSWGNQILIPFESEISNKLMQSKIINASLGAMKSFSFSIFHLRIRTVFVH